MNTKEQAMLTQDELVAGGMIGIMIALVLLLITGQI